MYFVEHDIGKRGDKMSQYRAIKYRIYPDETQTALMLHTFGCVRLVYNKTISMQQGLYEAGMTTFSKQDMNNYCNRFLKENLPFLRDVDKFALTNSIYDAFKAFQNFFEKRTGYPRFKSRKASISSLTSGSHPQRPAGTAEPSTRMWSWGKPTGFVHIAAQYLTATWTRLSTFATRGFVCSTQLLDSSFNNR